MDFTLTEDQRMLADSVERLVRQRHHFEARRNSLTRHGGFDPEHWSAFAELGLLGLTIPDDCGGLGAGGIETHLVMEAFGRALVVEPYLEVAVIAAGLIARAGSAEQRGRYLPAIADGSLRVVPALAEPQTHYTLNNVDTRVVRDDRDFILDGRKSVVIHGAQADILLVSVRMEGGLLDKDGIGLFTLERDRPGIRVVPYPTIHGAPCAELLFDAVRVPSSALLGSPGNAWPVIEQIADTASAALSAESVGIMAALLDATVAYAKQRRQFGTTLGSFQALKHQLVDMLLELEQARSLAWLASNSLEAPPDLRRARVSAAKHKAATASRLISEKAVQLHGGMGMTAELPIGHYMRRLIAIQHSFGDADHHLRRFITQRGAAPGMAA